MVLEWCDIVFLFKAPKLAEKLKSLKKKKKKSFTLLPVSPWQRMSIHFVTMAYRLCNAC